MRRIIPAAVVLLSVFATPPAFARVGPGFDCGKASTSIERTICGSDELAQADADLGAAYKALAARLDAPARRHLVTEENRWIARRGKACVGTAARIHECLKNDYAGRIDQLKLLGDGPYPFVSRHVLARSGRLKAVTYSVRAAYPRFDGSPFDDKGADFSAVNKRFADAAARAAAEAVPTSDVDLDREQEWYYDQDFVLHRPTATAITVVVGHNSFTGGAHPNGAAEATLVDLASGRTVGPAGVFGGDWLNTLLPIVTASLEHQFETRPGFDDALQPAKLGALLGDAGRYIYDRDHLTVAFNRYEVGPYVSGDFEVDIPYARLKPLLRADGPLGSLR